MSDLPERSLNEDTQALAELLRQLPDWLVGVSADGRIAYFSSPARRDAGHPVQAGSRRTAVGSPAIRLVRRRDRRRAEAMLQEALTTGDTREVTLGALTGPRQWAELRCHLAPVENVPGVAALISARPINRIVERFQAAAPGRISRLTPLGQLLSGVAHEVNQPLYAISNFAQACANSLRQGTEDPATVLEWIDEVVQSAGRAGEVIRRLRTFLDQDRLELASFELTSCIDEVLDEFAGWAAARSVGISFKSSQPTLLVRADRDRLQQVFRELLANALESLEARQTQGSPQSGTNEVRITLQEQGDRVEVTVADHGVGLPEKLSIRIFDPFVTTKPGRAGVGLAVSRAILDAHGEALWSMPLQEGGAVFGFHLGVVRE